jgi:hypothetical protein
VHHVHDAKLDRLEELLDEIKEPVLLCYPYQHDETRLKARFGRRLGLLKDKAYRAKWGTGGRQVLAMHPMSGGHGVDGLQNIARHVVWFGIDENLGMYIQVNGRLHRTGQKETVIVHRMITADTLEERIVHDVLPGKHTLQAALLARTKARA